MAVGNHWHNSINSCILYFCIPYINFLKQIIIDKVLIKDSFTIGLIKSDVEFTSITSYIAIIISAGFLLFFIFTKRKKVPEAFLFLSFSMALFIFSSIIILIPRIERHTQNTLIEFFKKVNDNPC